MSDGGMFTTGLSAEEKRAFLARLLRKEGHWHSLFPLSSAQRRMWILWQLNPDSPAYTIPAAVRFEGPVDVALLKQCFDEIVKRHQTLRTTFVVVGGQPMQAVAPAKKLAIPVVDLHHLSSDEQQAQVLHLATEEAKRPFDLTKGPLIRFFFLLLEIDLVMIVSMHHIVTDGWSLGILTREVEDLYEAFSSGNPSPLPELPIQYVDYAVWQRRQLQGEALERHQAYWKRQLAGAPDLLELPTDRPRPPVQTFNGATYTFTLAPALVEALRELSRREGVTLFMTMLAALNVLLYRYTAQEDILVGTAIANRKRVEVEGLIGFFVNTLVLRTNLEGNPSFRDLLKRVRHITLEAYEHQDLPFEHLLEILNLNRDMSRSPLFQVMLTLHDAILHDSSSRLIRIDNGAVMFDLPISLTDNGRSITVDCQYNTDLFDTATIARLATHFQTLLKGIVANPDHDISSLPILGQAERQQLLVAWNETKADYPGERCAHQIFEAQASRTPDTVAISFEDAQLTYRELNVRANQLAHHLRRLGIGPETLTGIYMERSIEMIVAVLAVLKGGGAYMPLDPTYPQERLSFMVHDARMSFLLTTDTLAQGFSVPDVLTVRLGVAWKQIGQESTENLDSNIVPDNLAYVLYTSGSTGKPKGVMVRHRGLGNLVQAQAAVFDVRPASRVLQFAPFSFDASVSEIFVTLLSGATLCLASQDALMPGPGLVNVLQSQSPSVLTCPPSVWAALPEAHLPHLQTAISAGEACPSSVVARWASQRRFINAYGPTEATVCATMTGRPIDNTKVYLLDRYLQPVPTGVPGEMYIHTVGLARGYIGRPDLTAERFMPDPFSKKPGARLYRTGDLARYRPDGNIEFLGRIDHQVKIRGFRVELGEVEAALRQQPDVHEVVVVAREIEHSPGNTQLVAYVVSRDQPVPDVSDLRRRLRQQLPEYMLPAVFVFLDALPLTSSGKVNRQVLPAPDKRRPGLEQTFVPPRTPLEQQLAAIWTEVLGIEQVGVHDNFFDLGGDSILAIQAITRANEAGGQFTLKHVFQHQTISELAKVAGGDAVVRAEQGPVTGELPLTPVQHWLFEQNQPEIYHFNQAILLTAKHPMDGAILGQALQALGYHHDVLRSRFVSRASGWRQICLPPGDFVPMIEVDLSTLPANEQLETLEVTATRLQASLDLSAGQLCRAAYFHSGPCHPDRLLIIMHHLVVDGVSWHILMEDLCTTYQQLSRGQVVTLLPKTTSFRRWSTKLAEYARSSAFQQEREYWLANGRNRASRLPVDLVSETVANNEALSRTVSVSLGPAETQALLQEVPRAYNTQINDALLAALVQAFAQWTGARDLLVDLEGHGREQLFEDVDLSRTVGWFTTIFPVYLSFDTASDPGHTLKAVKEQLRCVPNRGIGYGLLRYLGDGEAATRLKILPQAEVSFNYLGRLDPMWSGDWLLDSSIEAIGPLQSPRNGRPYLLSINSYIVDGQLVAKWTYGSAIHRQATIEQLAHRFIEALRAIIVHCQSPGVGGYTPSDFPLANLDEQGLSKLAGVLEQVD
jgi:amino acid adenylation domain-containing protein/non-ribosomal peptide synthase protein (TIGR01720 family)